MLSFLEHLKNLEFNKKLINQFGKYKVFIVNGEKIRKSILKNHEFGDFAIHDQFPSLIPKKEIWIDNTVIEKEHQFIITHALETYKCLKNGMPFDKAYTQGDKREEKMRKIIDGYKPKSKTIPKNLYKSLYCTISDIKVWFVDGEIVRDKFFVEWIEGGNGLGAYSWMPEHEIWIDQNVKPHEVPAIVLHEYSEGILMKYKKYSYSKAHEIASKIEFHKENENFNKSEVLKLTKDKIFKFIKIFNY